jgi:tRNA A-37 threonylcarbamoyl transferase component Bud32
MALYDYLLCGAGRDQTDFTVVRRGRVTWRVRRDLAGTIPAAVPDFPGAGDIIQSRKGRTCFRMPGRGGSALVVKRHRPRHWIEAPKYLIARTRACAEWRNAVAFAESGVSTARVLALGETRRLGFWTGSELVMEGVFPGSSLTAMLENGAPAAAIRPVLEKLAVQVARVHDAGFHHRDLHGGNVLVRTDANPGKPALYLVDLHEARRLKEAGRSVSVDDLGRLNSSVKLPPKLRLAFLGRYMECRGWPAHERNSLAREIDARSRAIWARHLQKHGTHIEQYE